MTLFDYAKIGSNIGIKNTHKVRKPEDLQIYEYIPPTKFTKEDLQSRGLTYTNLDEYEEERMLF
jgi:hypothetical protein